VPRDGTESTAPQDDRYDPEPGSAGISPVSEECLAEVEAGLCDDDHFTPAQLAMTENVARRCADHEIITALKTCNFEVRYTTTSLPSCRRTRWRC